MLLRRSALLFVVLCSLVNLAEAQQGGPRPRPPAGRSPGKGLPQESFFLAGRVLYAGRLEMVPRVPVKLFGRGGALIGMTFTDDRGEFKFRALGRGAYVVEVALEGYEVVRVRTHLYLGSRSDPTILLKRKIAFSPKPSGDAISVRELKVPPKARKAFERGLRELHKKGRPARSLAYFRKAIQLYPDYDEAYVQLSLAHIQQGEPAGAQPVLEKAITVNPENVRALMLLGTVYNQQGQAAEAIEALQQALKLDANAWQAHYELGKAFLQLGNAERGYPHARRAHELNRELPSVHLLVYNFCIARQDYETALAELNEFIEFYPENPLTSQVRQQRDLVRESLQAPQK